MKAYFKLLMLILVSTLYYGCSQDPYDWSGGKTTVAIKEISSPIVRYDMIRVQAKLDVRGDQIDNIYFVLYKNEGGNWRVEDERAPSLVDGTSDTYLLEFGGLTANTQYKVAIRIWANGSEDPIIEQELNVTTASAEFTLKTANAVVRNQYVVELYGNFYSEEIKATQDMLGFVVSETEANLGTIDLRPCLEINSDGSFSTVVDGLKPGTNYYYAACFVYAGKRYLSETNTFRTQDIEITEGSIIDLGLDVKWARCNLGSNTPEEAGKYYGWGDPHGISSMNRDDYPKLDSISGSGYDAAWYQLGEYYRIPTANEWDTLKSKCTWEWVVYKNVHGYKVTGPNGNSIFLPAAGCRWMSDGGIGYVGAQGFYRIGTQTQVGDYVRHFLLTEDEYYSNTSPREWGCSIRPVYDSRVSCITGGSTNITATSASIRQGYVKSSNVNLTEWGVWYGTKEYPNIREGAMCTSDNQDQIDVELQGLLINTTYYFCTYAKAGNQVYFGKVNKFTTSAEAKISTEEIVDLGLKVLWRGYNLGAQYPEEQGTETRWDEMFNEEPLTENICNTKYDLAHAKLGGNWRLPTRDEITELITKCIWKRIIYKNIDGFQAIGPNGNSIFFPQFDYSSGNWQFRDFEDTAYMSGMCHAIHDGSGAMYALGFNEKDVSLVSSYSTKNKETIIRPVQDK